MIFRVLSTQEAINFREHAEKHDPEKLDNWLIYHPVRRLAWMKRGISPFGQEEWNVIELAMLELEAAKYTEQN